ncbi:hypothetical protein [Dyadobacter sp. MSC1_007]|uniref:hypothetical protein n=1 Tax=Dyadobacter sp. MSC1_007 TaxID=2909264 RepID=UPI0038D3B9D8
MPLLYVSSRRLRLRRQSYHRQSLRSRHRHHRPSCRRSFHCPNGWYMARSQDRRSCGSRLFRLHYSGCGT